MRTANSSAEFHHDDMHRVKKAGPIFVGHLDHRRRHVLDPRAVEDGAIDQMDVHHPSLDLDRFGKRHHRTPISVGPIPRFIQRTPVVVGYEPRQARLVPLQHFDHAPCEVCARPRAAMITWLRWETLTPTSMATEDWLTPCSAHHNRSSCTIRPARAAPGSCVLTASLPTVAPRFRSP